MRLSIPALPLPLVLCAVVLGAAERKFPAGVYEDDRIQIKATVYPDRADIKRLLGSDFDGAIIVVDLTVTPLGEEPLDIQREQFQLFSTRDAQRSPPFHPAQLAGRGALVLGQAPGGGGTYVGNNPTGPRLGGIPLGNGGMVGGAGAGAGTSLESKGMTDTKEHPVLKVLKEKVLPEGKSLKPVSGLLYFGFDGKQKAKDLELFYRGPAGKFAVRFKN
ncbi:MAG: hypothetical protein NTX13_17420 [Acidobacteria bacterium]|nr:hypothetical protein [Acidobacteriota bacterium]